MRNRFRALAGMIFLGWSSLALTAAIAFEVGDRVVVARSCGLTRDGVQVDLAYFGQVAEIEAQEEGQVRLATGLSGWVDAACVLSLEEGKKLLSNCISQDPEALESLIN